MAGATMVWSSVPSEPSSPAWGLRPDTASRGLGEAEAGFQIRHRDAGRRDDQVARQLRDRLAQRKMDRHGHDGEGRRPQHHHRLRRVAAVGREFGEKFGMAGMPESGAVEHALGDRIGDDRAGPPGDDVADRLTNGGHRGVRAGVVRLAGLRGRRLAGRHDRQGVGECVERILGANVGEPDLRAREPSPARARKSRSPSR